MGVILEGQVITIIVKEEFSSDILQVFKDLQDDRSISFNVKVEVHSKAVYFEILKATGYVHS